MQRFHSHDLRRGRHSRSGGIYLVTTAVVGRRAVFASFAVARIAAEELHRAGTAGIADSLAWVVMPDHVHWLAGMRAAPLAEVVRAFKGRTARRANVARGCRGSLWQVGYHESALRAEEDVRAWVRYLVWNPVRSGLVERIGDYPFWDTCWVEAGAEWLG